MVSVDQIPENSPQPAKNQLKPGILGAGRGMRVGGYLISPNQGDRIA